MRSPLCVLKLFAKDGSYWRVFFSAATARGMKALTVVYLRPPTPEEREIVEEHVLSKEAVFCLDMLVQHNLFGESQVPAMLIADLPNQLDSLVEKVLADEALDSDEQTSDSDT
jgi:hypothetical protein